MDALLSSVNRTSERLKWGLAAHTVAMFSFVTIFTAINLDIQSISYIDNRDFPGDDFMLPPGPLGYQFLIYSKAISVVPNVMFYLNTCLADGLLVGCATNSITRVSNVGRSSSFIDVMLLMLKTTGLLPSRASCSLPLSVCVRDRPHPTATLD